MAQEEKLRLTPSEMKAFREKTGLSQEDFSTRYGIRLETVRRCEAGETLEMNKPGVLTEGERDQFQYFQAGGKIH